MLDAERRTRGERGQVFSQDIPVPTGERLPYQLRETENKNRHCPTLIRKQSEKLRSKPPGSLCRQLIRELSPQLFRQLIGSLCD
jgi:hypothetical protein